MLLGGGWGGSRVGRGVEGGRGEGKGGGAMCDV